jgi:SAM-dependent methyltransferase
MTEKEYQQAWENVSDINAHRVIDSEFMKKENLYSCYDIATSIFNLENASVLDIGCGGAFLGQYLIEKKKIQFYTGIDISQKSILAALKNLSKFNSSKYSILFSDTKLLNLDTFFADVLFCLSVIQHMPTKKYFDSFFKKIRNSFIPSLCLQIRAGEKTEFRENPYQKHADILYACITTEKDVSKVLSNYVLHSKTEVLDSGYQYLFYTLGDV